MAIEWAAVAAPVIPQIKKYAAERAGKLAAKYTDGVLSRVYRRIVPDEKLVKANEAFVSWSSKETRQCHGSGDPQYRVLPPRADTEHYGNLVGYLRSKGIVPPSTVRGRKRIPEPPIRNRKPETK